MQESQARRIQLSGGSTYVVSLPKEWVESMCVGAGDQVTLVRGPGRAVTVLPQEAPAGRPAASVAAGRTDTEESVKRKVIAAYLGGYSSIRVACAGARLKPSHARAVKDLVRTSMIGTEVVESSSESVLVQVLARLPELSFEAALSRMHAVASTMHREAVESFLEADVAHGEEVARMDDEVDRFGLYVRRNLAASVADAAVLREMGIKRAADCLGYRSVITRIERVADHAAMIAKRAKFLDGRVEPRLAGKIASLSEEALRAFGGAFGALERGDYGAAEAVAAEAGRAVDAEKALMAGVRDSARNAGVVRFVLEDLRRVAECSEDIAEAVIDGNVDSVVGSPGDIPKV